MIFIKKVGNENAQQKSGGDLLSLIKISQSWFGAFHHEKCFVKIKKCTGCLHIRLYIMLTGSCPSFLIWADSQRLSRK